MTRKIPLSFAAALALLVPASAHAQSVREGMCNWIIQNDNGTFSYQPQMAWSLQRTTSAEAVARLPENVTAVACLRDPPMLVEGDVEMLRSGRTVTLSMNDNGLLIVNYELADGEVTVSIAAGSPSRRTQRRIDSGLADVREVLAAAAD